MEDIIGPVVYGKQLGRTIGFPTANIDALTDWPRGVYAVDVYIDGVGAPRRAIMNIGSHPTAPEGPPTIEAHILNFGGDLYGHTLRIKYVSFMRPERKFDSLDALKAQLERDRVSAAAYDAPQPD